MQEGTEAMTGKANGDDDLPEGPPWFLFDEPVDWINNQTGTLGVMDIPWADKFAKALPSDLSQGPLAIAVFGPWGSGKTTVLRRLRPKGNTNVVWFEPWRYEREEHLLIPLLAEITSCLTRDAVENTRGDILKTGKKLLGRAAKFAMRAGIDWAVSASGASAIISAAGGKPEAIGEQIVGVFIDEAGARKKFQSEVDAFRDDFQTLVNAAFRNECPVYIMIDDLDRCSHLQVLRLLEAMKTFLWEPNVIFVLALDREQVTAAIAETLVSRFAGKDDPMFQARVLATRYLEKFFLHAIDIGHAFPSYEVGVRALKGTAPCQLQKYVERDWKRNKSATDPNEPVCNWDAVTGVFEHCDNNLRRIKRLARWVYLENLHCAHKNMESFSAALAEFALSEIFVELWVQEFAGRTLFARTRYYTALSAAMDAVMDQDDGGIDPELSVVALECFRFLENDPDLEHLNNFIERKSDPSLFRPIASNVGNVVAAIFVVADSGAGRTLHDILLSNDEDRFRALAYLVKEASHLRTALMPSSEASDENTTQAPN